MAVVSSLAPAAAVDVEDDVGDEEVWIDGAARFISDVRFPAALEPEGTKSTLGGSSPSAVLRWDSFKSSAFDVSINVPATAATTVTP